MTATCTATAHTRKVAMRMMDGSPDLFVVAVCSLPAEHGGSAHRDDQHDVEWPTRPPSST